MNWRLRLVCLVLVAILVPALVGCANTAAVGKTAPRLVWPSPPEEPRIAFIQSISHPADLGLKKSGWSRVTSWFIGTDSDESLVMPFGIALDEADNLCVTDTSARRVCYFDAAKKRWLRWERAEAVRFSSPVAVAKRGDALFVADSGLRHVIAFNTQGKLLFVITNELERPAGLAISGDTLFVVDSQLNRVIAFDLHGKFLSHFGKRGAGSGEFSFPTHIASDARGDLLVTDSMNARIQIFDREGHFKSVIGSAGDRPGHFGRPKGVAADSYGHVYVIDALFDTLQIFERDGRLALPLGGSGSERGEFWLPNGIAISRDNRIFIADSYNRRVQVLQYIGGP